jgi:hypothetical protein
MRLFRLMLACEELGLKVIFGEQSVEYYIFHKICRGNRTST